MDQAEVVFRSLESADQPMKAGEIAELSGLDRKEVEKAMKLLREEGRIISPKRCFWTTA